MPWTAPRKTPLAIVDWIAALAMRDYVKRHFERAPDCVQVLWQRRLDGIRSVVARQLDAGRVALAARAAQIDVSLSLDALVGKRFFARLARHLDRLLSLHGATLTLTIDRVPAREARDVERLLARLARHGDRVFVRLHRSLHERVRIDSSRFNLVLTGVAP